MISAICPGCQAKYRIPEDKAGRTLKCKKCGRSFKAPAADADEFADLIAEDLASAPPPKPVEAAPAPRRPAASKPRAAGSTERDGSNPLVLVLGGVIAFAVAGVGGYFAVSMLLNKDAAPVANAPAPANAPGGAPAPADAPGGVAAPAAPGAGANPERPAEPAAPAPAPVVPAPEAELAALEALTFESLQAQMANMESVKTEGVAESVGAGAVFRDVTMYRDPERGLEVQKTLQRSVGQGGTASTETYRVQQSSPRYAGWFLREGFGASDDSAFTQAPRRSGFWILKREDGTARARGEYLDGQRHGWFTFFDTDGSIIWQGLYLSGNLSRSTAFAPDQASYFGETALLLGDEAWLGAVAFSPNGELVAMGDASGFVWVRNVQTRELVSTLKVDHEVQALQFSPTEARLAIAHNGASGDVQRTRGYLTLWDYTVADQAPASREVYMRLNDLQFTPDGQTVLATLGLRGPVAAFAVAGGDAHIVAPGQMASYRNGEVLALGFGHEVVVLDGASVSFDSLPELRPNQRKVIDLDDLDEYAEFKQGWSQLAAGLRGPGGAPPQFISLQQVFETNTAPPVFLAGAEAMATLTPVGLQRAVAQAGQLPTSLPLADGHRSIAASADGSVFLTWLQSGDRDVGTLEHLRDGRTGEVLSILPNWPQARSKQHRIAPDGSSIAVTLDLSDRSDTQLAVYDVARGRLKVVETHVWDIEDVVYSADSRFLATIGKDSECFVWEVEKLLAPAAGAATPPQVTIKVEAADDPLQGDALVATVIGVSAEPDSLARQYRLRPDDPWRPFWGDTLKTGPLPAGKLDLEVRVSDSSGQEAVATQPVNVAPNPYAAWTLLHSGAPGVGRMLVTGKGRILRYGTSGEDPILELWTLPDFAPAALTSAAPPSRGRSFVGMLSVNPAETVVAVNNYTDSPTLTDVVSLLSLDDGRHLRDLPGDPDLNPNQQVEGLVFLPTGELVSIHAARHSSAARHVSVWNVESGERVNRFSVDGKLQSDLAVVATGPALVAGVLEGQVTTLSVVDGTISKGPFAQTFAFDPAGARLLCGRGFQKITSYAFPPFSTKPVGEFRDIVADNLLLLSPDGETLAIDDSSNQTLHIHRLADGRELRRFRISAGPESVVQAQFTSDGTRLVTLDNLGRICVWGPPD